MAKDELPAWSWQGMSGGSGKARCSFGLKQNNGSSLAYGRPVVLGMNKERQIVGRSESTNVSRLEALKQQCMNMRERIYLTAENSLRLRYVILDMIPYSSFRGSAPVSPWVGSTLKQTTIKDKMHYGVSGVG